MIVKIDLSKVKTRDYVTFINCITANPGLTLAALVVMLDSGIEGGVSDRPLTDLPAILSQAVKVLMEFNTDINLAIASMSEYLKGKQE